MKLFETHEHMEEIGLTCNNCIFAGMGKRKDDPNFNTNAEIYQIYTCKKRNFKTETIAIYKDEEYPNGYNYSSSNIIDFTLD